jgi:hypothetical protein
LYALKMSSTGASNERVMRISVSEGRVTTAEPCRLVTVSSWFLVLLVLELGDAIVEPVEGRVPRALEGAHPVVDGLQCWTVDAVPAVSTVGADEHETDGTQHTEVLGHLRLSEAEPIDELSHGGLPVAQGIEEDTTARLGDGVERVRRGCCASYVSIIFRYRNI